MFLNVQSVCGHLILHSQIVYTFSFFNLQQSEHNECTQENYASWRAYRDVFRHSYLVQQIKRNSHTSNFEGKTGKTISSGYSVYDTILPHLDMSILKHNIFRFFKNYCRVRALKTHLPTHWYTSMEERR